MNIKFKDHVEISSETFKISIQELIKFLEEFRGCLQEKIDFLIMTETRILVKRENQISCQMDQDYPEKDEIIIATEKIIPCLEAKMRRFSISHSGISLLKSLLSREN